MTRTCVVIGVVLVLLVGTVVCCGFGALMITMGGG